MSVPSIARSRMLTDQKGQLSTNLAPPGGSSTNPAWPYKWQRGPSPERWRPDVDTFATHIDAFFLHMRDDKNRMQGKQHPGSDVRPHSGTAGGGPSLSLSSQERKKAMNQSDRGASRNGTFGHDEEGRVHRGRAVDIGWKLFSDEDFHRASANSRYNAPSYPSMHAVTVGVHSDGFDNIADDDLELVAEGRHLTSKLHELQNEIRKTKELQYSSVIEKDDMASGNEHVNDVLLEEATNDIAEEWLDDADDMLNDMSHMQSELLTIQREIDELKQAAKAAIVEQEKEAIAKASEIKKVEKPDSRSVRHQLRAEATQLQEQLHNIMATTIDRMSLSETSSPMVDNQTNRMSQAEARLAELKRIQREGNQGSVSSPSRDPAVRAEINRLKQAINDLQARVDKMEPTFDVVVSQARQVAVEEDEPMETLEPVNDLVNRFIGSILQRLEAKASESKHEPSNDDLEKQHKVCHDRMSQLELEEDSKIRQMQQQIADAIDAKNSSKKESEAWRNALESALRQWHDKTERLLSDSAVRVSGAERRRNAAVAAEEAAKAVAAKANQSRDLAVAAMTDAVNRADSAEAALRTALQEKEKALIDKEKIFKEKEEWERIASMAESDCTEWRKRASVAMNDLARVSEEMKSAIDIGRKEVIPRAEAAERDSIEWRSKAAEWMRRAKEAQEDSNTWREATDEARKDAADLRKRLYDAATWHKGAVQDAEGRARDDLTKEIESWRRAANTSETEVSKWQRRATEARDEAARLLVRAENAEKFLEEIRRHHAEDSHELDLYRRKATDCEADSVLSWTRAKKAESALQGYEEKLHAMENECNEWKSRALQYETSLDNLRNETVEAVGGNVHTPGSPNDSITQSWRSRALRAESFNDEYRQKADEATQAEIYWRSEAEQLRRNADTRCLESDEMATLASRLAVSESAVAGAYETVEDYKQSLSELTIRLDTVTNDLREAQARATRAQHEADVAVYELSMIKEEVRTAEEARVRTQTSDALNITDPSADISVVNRLKAQCAGLQKALEQKTREAKMKAALIEELTPNDSSRTDAIHRLREDIDRKARELLAAETELSEARTEIKTLEERFNHLEAEFADEHAKRAKAESQLMQDNRPIAAKESNEVDSEELLCLRHENAMLVRSAVEMQRKMEQLKSSQNSKDNSKTPDVSSTELRQMRGILDGKILEVQDLSRRLDELQVQYTASQSMLAKQEKDAGEWRATAERLQLDGLRRIMGKTGEVPTNLKDPATDEELEIRFLQEKVHDLVVKVAEEERARFLVEEALAAKEMELLRFQQSGGK